jgi:hypothetical protein
MHILIADDHDFVCRSLKEIIAGTLVVLRLSARTRMKSEYDSVKRALTAKEG